MISKSADGYKVCCQKAAVMVEKPLAASKETSQEISRQRGDVQHGEYATQQDCSCTLKELKWPQHSNQMQRRRQSSSSNVASLVTTAMKRKGAGVIVMLPCNSIVAF